LAAAVRLSESGRRVTVLEATKACGGRARSFHDTVTDRVIDNGQHLVMGCYHELAAFLRTIEAPADAITYQRNLTVNMVKPGGQRIDLACPALPAPLHLAGGLATMRGLGGLHKLSALRAGLLLRTEVTRPDDNETCDAWLTRMGQTAGIRAAFWEPLIWATLNDDPLVASAAMLVAVLDRAFLRTRDASSLGVPRLPLSDIYVPHAERYLQVRGGEVRHAAPVRELVVEGARIAGARLKDGELVRADDVVLAVPPHAVGDLLPEAARHHPVFRDIARLDASPIVNLWAVVDRRVFEPPFVGLVSSPMHWIFDRDTIEPEAKARRGDRSEDRLISATISGARAFIEDDASSLRELFVQELARYFPDRPVRVKQFRAVKEKRATISHAAGTYMRRPETRAPIQGLWLAGDWVRTGIPATIEGAVQSGHDAAAALLGERRPPRD
jgi:squalene-associated FAD-dependent desaturase